MTTNNPFVAMMLEKLRPEIEAQMREAEQIARSQLMKELAEEKKPVVDNTDWTKVMKTCSNCSKTKPVVPGFGLAKSKRANKVTAQGWCLACRAGTNYHNLKRAYKTKNT